MTVELPSVVLLLRLIYVLIPLKNTYKFKYKTTTTKKYVGLLIKI